MTSEVDYSRKWYVLTAVSIGTFLSTIDGSIVNVSLPTMVRELDTTFAIAQWIILAYLLTQTTLLLSVGRLGDMKGKKPIYTAGIVVFTVGSVLCGLSPTVYWLIGSRVLQAIGAAMALALGMAIVTESFPPHERGKALGFNGTVVSVGIIAGPTIGGLILDAASWHWIFFVNLPIGIIGAVLAWRFLPDLRPKGGQRFDFAGAITLFLLLLSLLLALTIGQSRGFTDGWILALFGTTAVVLVIFLLIEWHTPQPMIDLRLFRNSLFSTNLTMAVLVFIAISGTTLLLPFYLGDMRGYPPRQVGLMMAAIPIFLGVVAPTAGALSDKYGTRPISTIGLIVLIGGYLALSRLNVTTSFWSYLLAATPLGVGMGIFQSPNNSAVMGAAPRERLGVASGLLAISRTLGQTTGIALMGAFWAARTMAYEGEILAGGATAATIPSQIGGLNNTFILMAGLAGVALALSRWRMIKAKKSQ